MFVKSLFVSAIFVASSAAAQSNCIVEHKTVSTQSVTIQERSALRREILPVTGGRQCRVDLRVRIGQEWHMAHGEYVWPGDTGADAACAVALDRAEQSVRERVSRSRVTSENLVICNDRTDTLSLSGVTQGTVGRAAQFRPHPDYPRKFWHNGAQCRMFVEPLFMDNDIRNFQGVVCEIGTDQWVVVDKF